MALDIRPSLQRTLKELEAERSQIDRQISAVTDALGAIGGRAARSAASGRKSANAPARRGRPKMSAAQKKAVSKRMKNYWAKRKKLEAAG
jgi:hypothetical protein